MVHLPDVETSFMSNFSVQGKAITIPALDLGHNFDPSEFQTAVCNAERTAFNHASKYCHDLKRFYKDAGAKRALPEHHPEYAAATLNGRPELNNYEMRTL